MLIRPRVTDHFEVYKSQSELDFAIQFLAEDIPLYVDPFLLWKSPSQQDQALHTTITNSFNHLNYLTKKGRSDEARTTLITLSECGEAGLGVSKSRKGLCIGEVQANDILSLFASIDEYSRFGFTHFETIQLYVGGISKDRISDFACNYIKSFLIDYTIDQCQTVGIPVFDVTLNAVYNYRNNCIDHNVRTKLPINPTNSRPLIFTPKRWLRFSPWISFDDYFRGYCPRDEIFNPGEPEERVKVLTYNREHYGTIDAYIQQKARTAQDCVNDPLFAQIPVLSAKRKLS